MFVEVHHNAVFVLGGKVGGDVFVCSISYFFFKRRVCILGGAV